jgi:hypothetical protein
MSAQAEISGQSYKTSSLPKTMIWRGTQRCSIILQRDFLLFCKVSAARRNGLTSRGGRLELI